MKRNMLIAGIVYIIIGLSFLLSGIFLETKLNSLFWGLAGAGIVPGLTVIIKYLYWSYPKNTSKYNDKVEKETINHLDERKEMHRNQAGRYAYNIGLIVV